jgi:hypothetical protein
MQPDNQSFLPELQDPEIAVPHRSRLYRLPPIGVGTGQAEGLVSYLIRLAREHSVNPRRMVRTVFSENNPEIARLQRAAFFAKYAGTIDGLDKYADMFARETCRLTGFDLPGSINLLPLRELLPGNGAGLLVPKPKWCPACIAEMRQTTDGVYRPLVWSFRLYRFCERHEIRLRDACPHCGKTRTFISRYPEQGKCQHCLGDLGANPDEQTVTASSQDRWVTTAISDIVAHLPQLEGVATAARFHYFLRRAIDLLADGNRAAFSRSLGLSPWAMKGWLCNGERPTLPQFLSVCQGLGIMPGQLFLSDPDGLIPSLHDKIHPVPSRLHERADRPLLGVRERRRLKAELVAIIENPDDGRSLKDVARDMGLTRSCLKYWFQEECRAIMARYAKIRNQRAIRYALSQQDEVAWVVRQFYLHGEYPSKRKVNRALSRRKMALASPHLLDTYRSELYRF